MAYGNRYTFTFTDLLAVPATWRVDVAQKDYVGPVSLLPLMAENPITIQRNSEEENKLSPFVGSKCVLRYVYDGTTETIHPRIFKDAEEDTFLVSVYKNDVLNFKGYVKPDGGRYPWMYFPFVYEINVTDYVNGFKNVTMDLNSSGKFYYGLMNIGSLFSRTLFRAANYTGVTLKAVFKIKLAAQAGLYGTLFDKLYVHSDMFYTLEEGPDTVYDAISKFLKATRCRLLFSAGTYWLQRVPDLYLPYTQVDQLTQANNSGTIEPVTNTHTYLPTEAIEIINDSATIRITPAILKQRTTYTLKALNQLPNFKWDDLVTTGPRTGWPVGWDSLTGGIVTRQGSGSTEDPYIMRLSGDATSFSGYLALGTGIPVKSEQYVVLNVKAGIYYTKGQYLKIMISPAIGGTGPNFYMDGSGNWDDHTDTRVLVSGDKKTRLGSLSITSKRLPPNDVSAWLLYISFDSITEADDPEDPVPPLQVPRNEIYPLFLRIFDNNVKAVRVDTRNSKTFSYAPPEENFSFLDMNDDKLSNNLYYLDGSTFKPAPFNDWLDADTGEQRNLDGWAAQTILDGFNVPSNSLEVEVISNTLEFHQTLIVPDLDDGVRLVQLSDSYDVITGRHSLVTEQVYPKLSGTGGYSLTSITQ